MTTAGFRAVLGNRHFRALWFAQLLAQTSQNAINFIQLVLVEQLTGSAMQLGITILAFTIPGIIFSPIAGVVVDRMSKKRILVGSNAIRVVLALSYVADLEPPARHAAADRDLHPHVSDLDASRSSLRRPKGPRSRCWWGRSTCWPRTRCSR